MKEGEWEEMMELGEGNVKKAVEVGRGERDWEK